MLCPLLNSYIWFHYKRCVCRRKEKNQTFGLHILNLTAHAAKDAKGIEADGILANLTEKTYLMHDHVKYNYRKEFLFKNIECIQHMERELERVFRDSGHQWAEDMKKLIQEMIHKRKEYLRAGKDSFTTEETNLFEEKMENLLVKGHREQEADPSHSPYHSPEARE